MILSFLLVPNILFSEDIEGAFSCKVQKHTDIMMRDGKAIYPDYPIHARIKKDDTIFINYTYLSDINTIEIIMDSNEADVNFYMPGYFYDYKNRRKENPKILYIVNDEKEFLATMSKDTISAEYYASKLSLTRYNENDWNALLTTSFVFNSSITGMNCRHVVNVLDAIFKKVKEKGY
jgi:hypothetical protein